MRLRALGTTSLFVSEIGFGAWGIGGGVYGPADDYESLSALQAAFDCGINFYDTADFYGAGRSEALIGQAFDGCRDKVIIATKGGLGEGYSGAYLRSAAEASLKRLRTDYIDLYQLHSPQLYEITDETLHALQSLQREGKIRYYGISARSPAEARLAVKQWSFPIVQVNFNLLDTRLLAERDLFTYGRGIIARTPLCFGFLTRRYDDAEFGAHDHRSNWSPKQRGRWAHAAALFSGIAFEEGQTAAQLALSFCLAHGISTAIPGMMRAEQVLENATQFPPLSAQRLKEIAELSAGQEFFMERK